MSKLPTTGENYSLENIYKCDVAAENYMIFCNVCNKLASAKAQSNQKRIVCKEVTAAALQQGRHDEVPARGGTAVHCSTAAAVPLGCSLVCGEEIKIGQRRHYQVTIYTAYTVDTVNTA